MTLFSTFDLAEVRGSATTVSALYPDILIIDSDPQVHRYLRSALMKAGYSPSGVNSGVLGLEMITAHPPDAVVLDLDVGDMDGKALLVQARKALIGPVLVVSSSERVVERIDALDLGADAVFAKPFSAGELLARLRVAFRQRILGMGRRPVIEAMDVTIDLVNRTVRFKESIVELTAQQYWVLARLAESGGGVLTHHDLISSQSADAGAQSLQNVRFLIRQLREKLEHDPKKPKVIKTDHRIGYRLSISR